MVRQGFFEKNLRYLFPLPAVLFVVVLMVFPVAYTFFLSFTDWTLTSGRPLSSTRADVAIAARSSTRCRAPRTRFAPPSARVCLSTTGLVRRWLPGENTSSHCRAQNATSFWWWGVTPFTSRVAASHQAWLSRKAWCQRWNGQSRHSGSLKRRSSAGGSTRRRAPTIVTHPTAVRCSMRWKRSGSSAHGRRRVTGRAQAERCGAWIWPSRASATACEPGPRRCGSLRPAVQRHRRSGQPRRSKRSPRPSRTSAAASKLLERTPDHVRGADGVAQTPNPARRRQSRWIARCENWPACATISGKSLTLT